MAIKDLYKIKRAIAKTFQDSSLLKEDQLNGKDAQIHIEPSKNPGSGDFPWIGIYFNDWEPIGWFGVGTNNIAGKRYEMAYNGTIWMIESSTDIKTLVERRDKLFAHTLETLQKDLTLDGNVLMFTITGGEFQNLSDAAGNWALDATINFTAKVRQ